MLELREQTVANTLQNALTKLREASRAMLSILSGAV